MLGTSMGKFTLDHLTGKGVHTQPNDQAMYLPRPVLNDIKDVARKAFTQMLNSSTPNLDFVAIRQRPNEPYMKFINRVALERRILLERAKEELLRNLAVFSANPE